MKYKDTHLCECGGALRTLASRVKKLKGYRQRNKVCLKCGEMTKTAEITEEDLSRLVSQAKAYLGEAERARVRDKIKAMSDALTA